MSFHKYLPALSLAIIVGLGLVVGCPQDGGTNGGAAGGAGCIPQDGTQLPPPGTPAPTARDDSYSTSTGSLEVTSENGVLQNDTFTAPATVSSDGTTSNGGTVTLAADGGFSYQALADFEGVDTFTYTLTDDGGSSTATVSITVTRTQPPPPPGPTANDDSYATSASILIVPADSGVLVNDTVTSPATVIAGAQVTTSGGTVTLAADGGFTYIPPSGLNAVDTFAYTVQDANGSASATVQITASLPTPEAATGVIGATVDGGPGDDFFEQGGNDDRVNGGEGDDTIIGNAGSDILNGGFEENTGAIDFLGDDVLIGGPGGDRIAGDVAFNLPGGSVNRMGDDLIEGGEDADNLLGDGVINSGIVTQAGHDILSGGPGADQLYGDFQILQITGSVTTCGNDVLLGGDDDDILVGDIGAQNGTVGTMGNDILRGGPGADTLYGDTITTTGDVTSFGNDLLEGGPDNDTLVGDTESTVPAGATLGADVFAFDLGGSFGDDQIRDYRASDGDAIRFTGVGDLDGSSAVDRADLDALVTMTLDSNGGNLRIVVTRRSDGVVLGSITFVNIAFAGQTTPEEAGITIQVTP